MFVVFEKKYSPERVVKIRKMFSEAFGFDKIAGMEQFKALLREEVLNPLSDSERYAKYRVGIPNGMLLF